MEQPADHAKKKKKKRSKKKPLPVASSDSEAALLSSPAPKWTDTPERDLVNLSMDEGPPTPVSEAKTPKKVSLKDDVPQTEGPQAEEVLELLLSKDEQKQIKGLRSITRDNFVFKIVSRVGDLMHPTQKSSHEVKKECLQALRRAVSKDLKGRMS